MSLGLQRAGLRLVGGIDHWDCAQRTFDFNLAPARCMNADLTNVSVQSILDFFSVEAKEIDVIVGGPPCQGFSTVGKRDEKDPRNRLWWHFYSLVAELRPAYILLENVEGILLMQKGAVRDSIISSFGELGYHMASSLLRAADYGVPQLRKRAFFMGWLDGLSAPGFPSKLREQYVSVEKAIFDLPALSSGESTDRYTHEPQSDYQRARRKNAATLHNHEAANHPADLVRILRHIPDGGNRKSIPDSLQPKSGFHNSYARLSSKKPAIAVTSNMRKPSSARATHPTQDRGLTVREGLRLQSFDDDFIVLGSRTAQYEQVGNAVPPLLASCIGKEILNAYASNRPETIVEVRMQPATALEHSVDESTPQLHLAY